MGTAARPPTFFGPRSRAVLGRRFLPSKIRSIPRPLDRTTRFTLFHERGHSAAKFSASLSAQSLPWKMQGNSSRSRTAQSNPYSPPPRGSLSRISLGGRLAFGYLISLVDL